MRKLAEEEIERYITAGKIAKSVLNRAIDYISPKLKINLLELCELIEASIIRHNALPAFPCNICFNEIAAHYTPMLPTEEITFDRGLLKVDVGVCVDGYIADSAITIARGDEYINMARKNEEILNNVIDYFKPGQKLSEIGRCIEKEALKNGYKPISNLSGHLIERYNLHAGKSVPNVYYPYLTVIEPWEVYAIEPFLTFQNAYGEVAETSSIRIFSLAKTKKIKDKSLDQVKRQIYDRYKFLPFTPRWLANEFGDVDRVIALLMEMRYLKTYPVLVEKARGPVSQFEHTIIVTDSGPLCITG